MKFKWECNCNDVSEWLRVVTPSAGTSEKVSTNRGFTFIPEKGDQVVVSFEEGNIARPIVLGSVYHGKSGTGGASNNVKSLSTRCGSSVTLNDGNGSVVVKDPSGGVLTMHGDGSVTLDAPGTFAVNAKDFIVNAGNSVAINAQPGEGGGGEGVVNISAKKSISGTADTEDISLTATAKGVTISGNTDVKVESLTAAANLIGSTVASLFGADVSVNAGTTIRVGSPDTDII